MNATPCPDCDPHGFDENMRHACGPPVEIGGVKVYAHPGVSRHDRFVDAKSFARSYCPKHGLRTTDARPEEK